MNVLALFALVPLLWLVVVGMDASAFVGLDGAAFWRATKNTAIYASSVTAAVSMLATPLSFLLARAEFASRRWLALCLGFPASLPALLLAMGVFDLFGTAATGALGTCAITAVAYLPWMLEPLVAALDRCDPALEEAARISGASPVRAFLQASFPLVRGELLASAALVFSMTGATFAVPYFLGTLGRSPFPTLTTEMLEQVSTGSFSRALLMSLPLVVLSVAATTLAARLSPSIADAGRPATAVRSRAPRWGVLVAWSYVALAIGAPLAALVARATASDPAAAFGSPRTFEAFASLMHHAALLHAGADSAVLATVAAITVVGLGALSIRPFARRVFAIIYALPGTLIALALLFFAASNVRVVLLDRLTIGFALQNTLALLAIAYVFKYLSAGIETARAAFSRVSPTLIEAARLSGAGQRLAHRHVTLPLALPTLLATGALLWMTFLPELTLSVLLFGPSTPTLGTTLFELATYTNPREAAALAVGLSAACMVLHTWRSRAH